MKERENVFSAKIKIHRKYFSFVKQPFLQVFFFIFLKSFQFAYMKMRFVVFLFNWMDLIIGSMHHQSLDLGSYLTWCVNVISNNVIRCVNQYARYVGYPNLAWDKYMMVWAWHGQGVQIRKCRTHHHSYHQPNPNLNLLFACEP